MPTANNGRGRVRAIAVVLAPMLMWAQAAQAGQSETLAMCRAHSDTAAAVMHERQDGARMADMVERVHKENDAGASKAITKLIVRAFEAPQDPSPKGRQNTVTAFENQIYLECIKFWMPQ